MNGILLVNKEKGMTSRDIVNIKPADCTLEPEFLFKNLFISFL